MDKNIYVIVSDGGTCERIEDHICSDNEDPCAIYDDYKDKYLKSGEVVYIDILEICGDEERIIKREKYNAE